MSNNERPSYYAIIPADVRYDTELKANEKLLYSEITALTNKTGECWASNKYFSDLYSVTSQAISKWLLNLQNKHYIDIEYIYYPKTKGIEKRVIKITADLSTNIDRVSTNVEGGYQQMLKENNTSMNNISLLKEKNTKKEKQAFITEFLNSIDNAELREAYSDFIDMRKEIKAPITTQRMLNVLKNKLNSITQDTQKQIELLNEAIFNKWKSVYPIKPKNAIQGKTDNNYGGFDLEKFEEKLNRD